MAVGDEDDQQEQATFGRWGHETPPPLVERKATRYVQADKKRLVGFTGYDRRREMRVYTTRRKDYHYYYGGDGYAVSETVVDTLVELDVPRIIIHEFTPEWNDESGDVYEFRTRDYVGGEYVHEDDLFDDQDDQLYVPLDEHLHEWPEYADSLFVRTFEGAMDNIHSHSRGQYR